MPVVIERPSLASRFFYLLRGFDMPLLIAVGLLALTGLLTMYSSGFANGERFWDQSRNLLIATVVMLVVPVQLKAIRVEDMHGAIVINRE